MANSLTETSVQSGFGSSQSMDPSTYGELLQFADEVARPTYAFGDYISGNWARKEQAYWQALRDKKANYDALQSARAYENTAIQRQVADMKAAGLNPYWLMNSGSVQGASSASESRNTYKTNTYKPNGSSASTMNDLFGFLKTLAVIAMVSG